MARKSPAFSFYPDSFLGGTSRFSMEHRGIYITLLCDQWLNGGFSWVVAKRLCADSTDESIQYVLKAKFKADETGRFFNARLEQERQKQEKRSTTARENGKKGGRPKPNDNPDNNPKHNPTNNPNHNPQQKLSVSDSVSVLNTVSDSKNGRAPGKRAVQRPEAIDETVWLDWIAARKAKRVGMVTATVLTSVESQAAIAGISTEQAIRICAERGWATFDASWDWQSKPKTNGRGQTPGAKENAPATL